MPDNRWLQLNKRTFFLVSNWVAYKTGATCKMAKKWQDSDTIGHEQQNLENTEIIKVFVP